MSDFVVPRCSHGNIILGCPHDDCPEQNKYLDETRAAAAVWEDRQRDAARDIVRNLMHGRPV